eukprot:CAMPEP_0184330588 /NCGR_PEP_ID=MMETSP1049-20130417/144762_1 /TAXON_ID=77928 /ORGANISM="Proteomonas sulcata, Strain CCMP704" /LENGTH=46 /DNA_ID= /DNA_START= /DNA_END= /DNA_ORIENTATION=
MASSAPAPLGTLGLAPGPASNSAPSSLNLLGSSALEISKPVELSLK